MAGIRLFLLLLATATYSAFAGEQGSPFRSEQEAWQHFFGDRERYVLAGQSSFTDLLQQPSEAKKSVGLAAVYSMILPGMGELYVGAFGSGKYFLIAEGALWLTYTTLEVYGNALRDDARAFAASRAGVNLAGKNDQYFVDIGNFLDISEYNDKKLRDREPLKLYDPKAGYAWSWESDAARSSYREQRVASDNMYNNRKFVVGAVIINHLASAINAARAALSHNKDVDGQSGAVRFKADVMGGLTHPHGILLTVTKEF